MMKRSKPPLLYDPLIIPRVKQYLEENVHQTYVDVTVMAKELQDRYREYSRRKTVPFRILVEQAYKTVLHSYGLDSNPSSENDNDANSDLELMDENSQPNHMTDTINSMYMNNKNKSIAQNADELIDISSDESGDEEGIPTTTSNDPTILTDKTDLKLVKGLEYPAVPGITITKLKHSSHCNSTGTHHERNSDIKVPTLRKIGSNYPPQLQPPMMHNDKSHQRNHDQMKHLRQQNHQIQPQASDMTHVNKKRKTDNGSEITYQGATSVKVKKYKSAVIPKNSNTFFMDVGGMDKILKELCELLLHIKHPEVYRHIGLPPPRGFLLHGPPGCGKTLLAQAIAGQLNVPLIEITATELIAGVSGESEERIRDLFEQATAIAPCVLFIDEVDAISSNRIHASKDMERRIVTQLLSSMDALGNQDKGDQVLVIGATNRPDSLDPALRRVGRFDQEISLGIPDRDSRIKILEVICDPLQIERPFDFEKVAELTPGYVGADLLALATRAASLAIKRAFLDKEEEVMRKKIQRVTKKKPAIPPIVNLIDDTILMDVDDIVAEANESTNKNAKVDNPTVSSTPSGNGELKEATASIQNTKDNNENDKDKTKDTTEVGVVAETTPATSTTTSAGDDKVKVDSTENDDIVEVGEDKSSENKIESTTILNNKESAKIKENGEKVEIIDTMVDTLEDQFLNHPDLKFNLSLNEMMNWLSEEEAPIYGTDLENLCITLDDFCEAVKHVQPSAKREGFITVPDTTWDQIGSLRDIREELKLAILAPVKFPQKLEILGLTAPSGVLLCGPPGCGKTLLAKAIANEAGINFISVKGPELLNMYVGESERAVRQCFQRARNSAPCVIFFDEFDSLCPKRSDTGEGGASMRVVNQLLTEMDGIEGRKGVFLMAASNRPDIIDPAVLRPGRLDKILYVGLPHEADRVDILKALTKNGSKPLLSSDVVLEEFASLTEGFTGADLAGLVRQASLHALKDSITMDTSITIDVEDDLKVTKNHFKLALDQIKPSVSLEDQKHYEKLKQKYAAPNQLKKKHQPIPQSSL